MYWQILGDIENLEWKSVLTKAWGKVQFHAILFQFFQVFNEFREKKERKCWQMLGYGQAGIIPHSVSRTLFKIK